MRNQIFQDENITAYLNDEVAAANSGRPLLEIVFNGVSDFYRDDDLLPDGRTAAEFKLLVEDHAQEQSRSVRAEAAEEVEAEVSDEDPAQENPPDEQLRTLFGEDRAALSLHGLRIRYY